MGDMRGCIIGKLTLDEGQVMKIKSVPGRIRTCDLRFRKPPLYPAELRGRVVEIYKRNSLTNQAFQNVLEKFQFIWNFKKNPPSHPLPRTTCVGEDGRGLHFRTSSAFQELVRNCYPSGPSLTIRTPSDKTKFSGVAVGLIILLKGLSQCG